MDTKDKEITLSHICELIQGKIRLASIGECLDVNFNWEIIIEEYASLKLAQQKEEYEKKMEDFAEWLGKNGFTYNKGLWYGRFDSNHTPLPQLRELFEKENQEQNKKI